MGRDKSQNGSFPKCSCSQKLQVRLVTTSPVKIVEMGEAMPCTLSLLQVHNSKQSHACMYIIIIVTPVYVLKARLGVATVGEEGKGRRRRGPTYYRLKVFRGSKAGHASLTHKVPTLVAVEDPGLGFLHVGAMHFRKCRFLGMIVK